MALSWHMEVGLPPSLAALGLVVSLHVLHPGAAVEPLVVAGETCCITRLKAAFALVAFGSKIELRSAANECGEFHE